MFIENFSKFIKYYGEGQKIKLFGFFILSLIAGLLEFCGIAMIYPFILLIINPESVIKTKYYADFAAFFNVDNVLINAFILGALVVLLFIFKNLFMIFSLYLQNRFVSNWKFRINKKFMHYYLFSPYKESLKTAPSEKIYNINFLVLNSLDGFIFRGINLLTNVIIVVMILGLLFSKFFFAALVTCVFAFVSMFFQYKFFKAKMKTISKDLLKESSAANRKTMENINNLKEIKILSAEDNFYNDYLKSQSNYLKVSFKNNFYGTISPYITETFAVIAMLLLAGVISFQNMENTPWMIASYGVVVAAIFRIAPALNRIQMSINSINSSRDLVKTMLKEYEEMNPDYIEEKSSADIKFKDNIQLKNVYFSYKKTPVIKNLNIEIKKGEFIGMIGLSGAGKSTLADIIMGLLPIDSGEIKVDGIEINSRNFASLRKLIGYVPQQINILDGSFKRNVAFGVLREDEIDEKKVVDCLKKAKLDDVVKEFEEGINASVINGSVGLSQGQKQRLAIARALYRDSDILIFDEATSSLDVETEHEITQMLNDLKGDNTIIAIAHRLSTLKSCDRLIYHKSGEVVDIGTFDELSKKHPDFEKVIKMASLK